MRAELHDITFTREGKQIVSFVTGEDFRETFDELHGKPLTVEVKRYREKRSKNANDYLWTLCTKISEHQCVTPEEVYRKEIREAGVSVAMSVLSDHYDKVASAWRERGIGWFFVKTDEGNGTTFFLAYYGSSSYDTKEMSKLIENTIQDCKALGIETATPAELALLMDDWERKHT